MLTSTTDGPGEPAGSGAPAPTESIHNGNGGSSKRSALLARPSRHVRRPLTGPLLLYALFAAFFMLPFAPSRMVESPANDLGAHLSGIIEAANALAEGQFPVRVAPRQLNGIRYPVLQFYGNFPYTVGAVLTYVPGVDPYTAWRLISFLCVTLAGFYTYRSALALTRQVWPSLIAGVVFVASPYLSTDVRARFAFPEAVSFCLLPAVFYYSWRAFVTPRHAPRHVLLGAVFWSFVALSHNITLLYGSALIGLFFLTLLKFRPQKDFWRFLRVGGCYGLGMVLTLWYLVPQLKVLHYITIAQGGGKPMFSASFVSLRVLLSPMLTISPSAIGTPNLGLQIGWPILAAALLGAGLLVRGFALRGIRWALLARLLAAFLLAAFIVWSPFDFWQYVPSVFYNTQFTYRILMFVVLWGSLLAGVVLAMRLGRQGGTMSFRAGWLCLIAIGVAAMPYTIWRHGRMDKGAVAALIASPDMGGQVAIAYRPVDAMIEKDRRVIDSGRGVPVISADQVAQGVRYGKTTIYYGSVARDSIVQLPVLFYPDLMEVLEDGRPVTFGHLDGLVSLFVPTGPHLVQVTFTGVHWANRLSALGWLAVLIVGAVAIVRRKSGMSVVPSRAGMRPGSAFPVRAAPVAFALLAVPLTLTAAYTPLKRYYQRRTVGTITASSESAGSLKAEFAFDDDDRTAWAAAGSGPATITVVPPRKRMVARIVLEPRRTLLLEGWHKVEVVLYLRGQKLAEQTFTLPNAPSEPVQELRLDKRAKADRIELRLSDPVTVTPTGDRVYDPSAVNPGYREIRFYPD